MSTLDHPLAAQPPTVAGPFDWIDALPDPALVIDAGKDRVLAANRHWPGCWAGAVRRWKAPTPPSCFPANGRSW